MGAGYHTIHHTVYKHNYGEYVSLVSLSGWRSQLQLPSLSNASGMVPPRGILHLLRAKLQSWLMVCLHLWRRPLLYIHGQALRLACDADRVCRCHGEARQRPEGSLAVV
jgi:hypothetical protein